MTDQEILQILPSSSKVSRAFLSFINSSMSLCSVIGVKRAAAFISQVGHESGQLTRLVENLNYSADGLANTWPNRYAESDGKGGYVKVMVNGRQRNKPNPLGLSLERKPEQIANNVYAGRMGNTAPGDGWKYRGRGLIQLTGKTNYRLCGEALGLDLLGRPELLEEPEHACMAAGWFWKSNGLNELADKGDIEGITRRINGGINGMADRKALYERALKVLA